MRRIGEAFVWFIVGGMFGAAVMRWIDGPTTPPPAATAAAPPLAAAPTPPSAMATAPRPSKPPEVTVTAEVEGAPAPRATKLQLDGLPPGMLEMLVRLQAQDSIDFEAQKRDEAWAARQEATLSALFARNTALLPPGASFGPIDCRTTVCRVELLGMPVHQELNPNTDTEALTDLLKSLRYGVSSTYSFDRGSSAATWKLLSRPDVQDLVPTH